MKLKQLWQRMLPNHRWSCRLSGTHARLTVIEVYERTIKPVPPVLIPGMHAMTLPHFEDTIRGKFKCDRCGQTIVTTATNKVYPTAQIVHLPTPPEAP